MGNTLCEIVKLCDLHYNGDLGLGGGAWLEDSLGRLSYVLCAVPSWRDGDRQALSPRVL